MKIYSMTATFGKLSHQTLTLKPGLNIIEAPNEWGKSTWCAFLVAMLYGINSREQTKTGFLADKEHYMPWSGEPMSGSMDLNWNGRDITIQRRNKGRGFFNEFKAFETDTGVAVEELSAANCGQILLGVEQSVFTRAGFLRQSDLPVTADEKLRSRLNALVTTGDESGESEELAQKLKEIKNKCRFNKTGLLPQAEARRAELEGTLSRLQGLHARSEAIARRQQELKDQREELENHQLALEQQAAQAYMQKLDAARHQHQMATRQVKELRELCAETPGAETIRQQLQQLRQLLSDRDRLHQQIRLLPPAPQATQVPEVFRGTDPQAAMEQARENAAACAGNGKGKKTGLWLPIVMVAVGVAALFLDHWVARIIGGVLMAAALLWGGSIMADRRRREQATQAMGAKYGSLDPAQWIAAAENYASGQQAYAEALAQYRQKQESLEKQMQAAESRIAEITGDTPAFEWESRMLQMQSRHRMLEEALREEARAADLVRTLEGSFREVPSPQREDRLDWSAEQTQRMLARTEMEQTQLLEQLGQCQGQIKALGQPEQLQEELQNLQERIGKLEQVYRATTYALQMQEAAARELQRRFAPRISKRAQELLGRLTGGRYDRLVLDHDLQLSSGARGEDTLRSNLWRSDGTADQLYLALRLAVAEELTPEAPLVLDDALVRFDEVRMAAALEILRELSAEKQVILFTCQSREAALQAKQEENV